MAVRFLTEEDMGGANVIQLNVGFWFTGSLRKQVMIVNTIVMRAGPRA